MTTNPENTPAVLDRLWDDITPINNDAAIWDAQDQTLIYVSGMGYSSSCPPTATAKSTDGNAVVLELEEYRGGGACTADAGRATVTVHGLTEAPTRLTVTALGTTSAVEVQQAPTNAGVFALDCESETHVSSVFDRIVDEAEGFATPEEAVASMMAEDESAVVGEEAPDAENVKVALLRADRSTRAVVTLDRVSGGWLAGSVDNCTGESLGRRR